MGHLLGSMVCEGIGWQRAWKVASGRTWGLEKGIQPWKGAVRSSKFTTVPAPSLSSNPHPQPLPVPNHQSQPK